MAHSVDLTQSLSLWSMGLHGNLVIYYLPLPLTGRLDGQNYMSLSNICASDGLFIFSAQELGVFQLLV